MTTKDIPSNAPSFIEAFKEGFGQKGTNLSILDHPLMCNLGIQNKVDIPNEMVDLRLMPLFLIEHSIVWMDLCFKMHKHYTKYDV